MESTIAKTALEQGILVALALLFIYLIIYSFKEIRPELKARNTSESELKRIAIAAVDAQKAVAESNNNIAKSMEIINATMLGTMEIIKLQHEDTRETQARLYAHDDRSEKIFTMVLQLYTDRYGKPDL